MKIFSKIGCCILVALSIFISSYPCFAAGTLLEKIEINSHSALSFFLQYGIWQDHNRLVATRSIELAYPVSSMPYGRAAVAPKVTLKPGFSVANGNTFYAGSLVFNLNIVDLEGVSNFPEGGTGPNRVMTQEDAELLVERINEQFINEDGEQIVRYRLTGFVPHSEVANSTGGLADNESVLNHLVPAGTDATKWPKWVRQNFNDMFDACDTHNGDFNICDHNAVNLYIFEHRFYLKDPTTDKQSGSRAQMGSYNPSVLIHTPNVEDFIRGTSQTIIHELGHTFHLGHVVEGSVTSNTDLSNTMSKGRKATTQDDYCKKQWGTLTPKDGNRAGGFSYSSYGYHCNHNDSSIAWADQTVQTYREYLGTTIAPFPDDDNDDELFDQMSQIYWYGVKIMDNLSSN